MIKLFNRKILKVPWAILLSERFYMVILSALILFTLTVIMVALAENMVHWRKVLFDWEVFFASFF